jgi:lauroyl/myristoyl acyltransferase
MFKLVFIIFFNLIFLPLYSFFAIACFLLAFIPIFPVRTAHENVSSKLGYSGLKKHFFVTAVFLNYCFYFVEVIFFEVFQIRWMTFENEFKLSQYLTSLKAMYPKGATSGFTYLGCHFGNLESYSSPIIEANNEIQEVGLSSLAKRSKSKIMNKVFDRMRNRKGLSMIWTDQHMLKNMLVAIKKGNSMLYFADQKPKSKGAFFKFFGEYSSFPTGGLKFSIQHNSIFVYMTSRRIIPGWFFYTFQGGKNLHLMDDTQTAAIKVISELKSSALVGAEIYESHLSDNQNKFGYLEMSYYVKWLENNIRKSATQWCWDYRKWSRKPSE